MLKRDRKVRSVTMNKPLESNQSRNSILRTRHSPDLGSASDCMKQIFPRDKTDQKHYPHLGNNASKVWNFCARLSDVISRGNQLWRHEMSAIFSG